MISDPENPRVNVFKPYFELLASLSENGKIWLFKNRMKLCQTAPSAKGLKPAYVSYSLRSMDAKNCFPQVLEIRFRCVSFAQKKFSLQNFFFFVIKLLITMQGHILWKKLSEILKEDKILLQKKYASIFFGPRNIMFFTAKNDEKKTSVQALMG